MVTAGRNGDPRSPADQATVRRLNLALVMRRLAGGPRTRARLAEDTGLNKATVSSLIAELIDRDLVIEGHIDRGGLGRPGRTVGIHSGGPRFVGVELQTGYAEGVLTDLTGRVLARRRVAESMTELGPDRSLDLVADLARELVDHGDAHPGDVQSVQLAVPGLVDTAAGVLSFAPNLHWTDLDVVRILRDRLAWPTARIGVDNDANMGAMAHWAAGDVAGTRNLVYLAGNAGVGAGLIVDGHIARGSSGFAGEVGHLAIGPSDRLCGCGRNGCWETAVGLTALLGAVAEPGDPLRDQHIDVEVRLQGVCDLIAGGDARARRAVRDQGRWLGAGVAMLCQVLDPDVVVLGGHFPALREHLQDAVANALQTAALPPGGLRTRVVFSPLGFSAVALGAAHVGIDQVLADPTLVPVLTPARQAGSA